MKRIIRDSVTSSNNKPKNAVWVKDGQDMKWKIFKGTNNDTIDPDFLSLANKRNHANYIDVIVVPNGMHPNEVINSSSQNEYEYRKNIYLKRKHEFETLGEDDNNDALSREEKMNIAKAEMDKVAPESVDSANKHAIHSSSYTPDMLDELINYYSSQDTMSYEDIWDEIVNQYHNEALADDVLDGLDELKAEDDIYSADDIGDMYDDNVDDIEHEFQRIDRSGTDEDVEIAAIMYNLGITMKEARETLPTLSKDKIKDYVDYYYLRDLPASERVKIWNKRKITSATNSEYAQMVDDLDYFYEVYPEAIEPILIRNGANLDNNNWLDGCNIPQAYNEAVAYFESKYDNDDEYSELDTGVGSRLGWSNYIQSGIYEETEDPKWICLDIKHVRDSDGMLTDYALYTTEDEDKYICMFGDVDAYPPDEMYADAEFDSEEEALEWFEDYTGPGDEDEDEDYDVYHDDIDSAEELDEDEDDLDHPDQEFDSADTSINSTKLPAIYKMISIPEGSVGIDFGGGKWDNAIEHIRDLGATLCVYDPYNRSKAYNKETLKTLRANGGADWAVTSNVLNVIKEPSARKAVLENISKITKSGAPIYITVYEGRGDSKAGQTKSGYQLNRKTKDYMEEIQEVFPDATRKGKLIIAHNIRSASSSTVVTAASSGKLDKYMNVTKDRKKYAVHYTEVNTDQDAWTIYSDFRAQVSKIAPYDDADYAWADIRNGHIDVIRNGKVVKRSYYFNADDMEVENTEWCDIIIDEAIDLIAKINKDIEPRMVYNSTSIETSADTKLESYRRRVYSKIYHFMTDRLGFDLTEVADYVTVDCTESEDGRIKIEVRAELDYDDMWELKTTIDPVVENIDKNAYFDFEYPGVLVAYVSSKPANSRYVHAADEPEHKTEPDDEYEPEEVDEDVTVEFDMDRVRIDVDKSGSWEYMDDSFLDDVMTDDDTLYSEEYDVKVRDRNGLLEDIDDILKYDIPVEAGEYRISCHITLVYHITGIEKYDEYPDDNYGDSSEYSTENAEVKFDFHDSYVEDFRIVD